MSFVLKQTVDLSPLGWDGCSIILKSLSYKEAQDLQLKFKDVDPTDPKAQTETFDFLKTRFVSGTGFDENDKKVDLKVDDLQDLPLEVFMACVNKLTGTTPNPN